MYPVSQDYIDAIYNNDERNTKIEGTVILKDNSAINVTSEHIIPGSLYISEQCFSGDDIDIGSVYASEIGFSLLTDITNPYALNGARIQLDFGIDTTGELNFEYVPLGYYYVTDIERKTRSVNIKGLDGMVLFDREDLIGVLRTGTPRELIDSICTKVGVLLYTDVSTFATFPNAPTVFILPEDSKVETCRDYLMWVCQLIGCFARMNRMGHLEIVPVEVRDSVITILPEHRMSSNVSDFYTKVTRLSMKIGETEYSRGDDTGGSMNLEENPLLIEEGESKINTVLANILPSLAEYTPFNADLYGDPALQAGDFIDIKVDRNIDLYPNADENGIVKSLISHHTWRYRGTHNIKAAGKSDVLKNVSSQDKKSTAQASAQAQQASRIADAAQRAAESAEEEARLAQEQAEEAQALADAAGQAAAGAAQVANTANQNALNAAGLAEGKGKVIYSTTTPPASDRNVNNLWIDTSGTPPKNQPKRWNGFEWVAVTDQIAIDAAAQAAIANTLAASKVTTLYQATAPGATGRTVGDLWMNTADKNKLHRWNGSAWIAVDDQRLQEALDAAADATALADGKIRTFAQPTAPGGMTLDDEGDLWIDTDDQNKMYRWSGTGWVIFRDEGIGNAQQAADAAAGVAATAQAAASDAAQAAQNARNVADAAALSAQQAQAEADAAAQAAQQAQLEADAAAQVASTAQSNASSAQSTANAAQTAAQNANSTLSDLANDNKLTPDEKQTTRKEWNIIAGEKAGINTQATSFGITTENTAYNNAYIALGTYLNNGTAYTSGIPTWVTDTNLGTTTTIVGATFRDKFKAYYDARTALLNAISAKAKSLADAAQVKANSAQTTASNAQTAASNAASAASTAQSTANSAQTAAGNAANAANAAQNTADAAQQAAQNAAQLAQEAKDIATAANQSTQLINDAIGGNVLIREKSTTNEILIMDSANPAQAKRMWRWNLGGLGYSDNVIGADNPSRTYKVAMTMDGAINADFITAGTIRGIEIIGATFRTSGTNNRLQMDTTFKAYYSGIRRAEIDYRSMKFYDPAGTLLGTIIADNNTIDGATNIFGIYVPYSSSYTRILNVIAPKIFLDSSEGIFVGGNMDIEGDFSINGESLTPQRIDFTLTNIFFSPGNINSNYIIYNQVTKLCELNAFFVRGSAITGGHWYDVTVLPYKPARTIYFIAHREGSTDAGVVETIKCRIDTNGILYILLMNSVSIVTQYRLHTTFYTN